LFEQQFQLFSLLILAFKVKQALGISARDKAGAGELPGGFASEELPANIL
jgi:hypothetical protein